jgi:hypothetical protein
MRCETYPALLLFGALVGLGGCASSPGESHPTAGTAGQPPSGGAAPGGGATNGNHDSAGATSLPGGGTGGGGQAPNGGSPAGAGDGAGGSTSQGGGTAVTPKDCKRGIAWHGSELSHPQVTAQLTWWYSWGLGVRTVGAGLEFVPMQWGGGSKLENIESALRPDAKYLLGYNEPNFFEQANLSAVQAAADWPTLESAARKHDLKLVSPAVNYCGDDKTGAGPCHDTNPVGYLQDFFAACQGCQVDYVAVHWYNCDGASLESYLNLFAQFNRPLWLTEVACAYGGDTSLAGQERYMREAVPILEARADVFRYSWFSGDPLPNARLLDAEGAPTALGEVYLSLPRDPTCTP